MEVAQLFSGTVVGSNCSFHLERVPFMQFRDPWLAPDATARTGGRPPLALELAFLSECLCVRFSGCARTAPSVPSRVPEALRARHAQQEDEPRAGLLTEPARFPVGTGLPLPTSASPVWLSWPCGGCLEIVPILQGRWSSPVLPPGTALGR